MAQNSKIFFAVLVVASFGSLACETQLRNTENQADAIPARQADSGTPAEPGVPAAATKSDAGAGETVPPCCAKDAGVSESLEGGPENLSADSGTEPEVSLDSGIVEAPDAGQPVAKPDSGFDDSLPRYYGELPWIDPADERALCEFWETFAGAVITSRTVESKCSLSNTPAFGDEFQTLYAPPATGIEKLACPVDMVPLFGTSSCIERFPRGATFFQLERYNGSPTNRPVPDPPHGVTPGDVSCDDGYSWQVIADSCAATGRRICYPWEWVASCTGPEGATYLGGDEWVRNAVAEYERTGEEQDDKPLGAPLGCETLFEKVMTEPIVHKLPFGCSALWPDSNGAFAMWRGTPTYTNEGTAGIFFSNLDVIPEGTLQFFERCDGYVSHIFDKQDRYNFIRPGRCCLDVRRCADVEAMK